MRTNDIQIALPASKSLSNRWVVLNYISGNRFQLMGLSTSDDTLLLRRLLDQLSRFDPAANSSMVFYCDNAGTPARFLTALLAVTPGSFLVTGDERLRQRPIADLVQTLSDMGCNLSYPDREGSLPVHIEGSLPRRKMAFVNPSKSSQFVSALLLMAPALPTGMRLSLTAPATSRPYIDMTLGVLREAGIEVKASQSNRVISTGSFQLSAPQRKMVRIEKDWTSASYFYEVAALCPEKRIRLTGLSTQSLQGDAVLVRIFAQMGVSTTQVRSPYRRESSSLRIQGGGPRVEHFRYNFRHCPDLVPAVAVSLAALGIRATLVGVSNLRLKESDRLHAIVTELTAMGVRVRIGKNGDLNIYPSQLLPTRPVQSYSDHRIVMAFAPLQLLFPDLQVLDPDSVSKSFPGFWDEFAKCLNPNHPI